MKLKKCQVFVCIIYFIRLFFEKENSASLEPLVVVELDRRHLPLAEQTQQNKSPSTF